MTGIHSGVDGPFGQDFSMIMQESSGSDCTMGMSFSGKGVNPSYTKVGAIIGQESGCGL